jgi:uncharacterized protein YbjQ (UPF0145 family)
MSAENGTTPAATPAATPSELNAEMLRGAQSVATAPAPNKNRGITSDLSIDEALLLHAAGWEPVDLVCGVSIASVPYGVWTWGQGEISTASTAHNAAVQGASNRILEECRKVHGHGVVGVRIEVEVRNHHIDVELVGTAVRPVGDASPPALPFVSDLSARDFTLLKGAGWMPAGLAFGASFVYAPRRSAGAAMQQKTQNIELTNFTQAMYAARESAMERMQQSAINVGGHGVVGVKVTEGPMSFARHAVGFTAWGTTVKLVADVHKNITPQVILPLDDAVVTFAAQNLRGS